MIDQAANANRGQKFANQRHPLCGVSDSSVVAN
jgi:hypothetical protein